MIMSWAIILKEKMEEISKRCFLSKWQNNLGKNLYNIILSKYNYTKKNWHVSFGSNDIIYSEIKELIKLRDNSQGWWFWSDDLNLCVFISLDDWKEVIKVIK